MIRLMHQLASAKQRLLDVLSWAMRPRRLPAGGLRHSTDLVDAVYRSEVTYLTLCS